VVQASFTSFNFNVVVSNVCQHYGWTFRETRAKDRLHLHQGSPKYSPWAKCGPQSYFTRPAKRLHPAARRFVNNEKILYLGKISWFGKMQHILKQPRYVRLPDLEMFCIKVMWPSEKKFGDPWLTRLTFTSDVLGRPLLPLSTNTVPVFINFLCHAQIEGHDGGSLSYLVLPFRCVCMSDFVSINHDTHCAFSWEAEAIFSVIFNSNLRKHNAFERIPETKNFSMITKL